MPNGSRNWVFTVNGDEPTLTAWYCSMVDRGESDLEMKSCGIRAIAFQPEKASSLHIQGFVQFEEQKSMSAAKRQLFPEIVCPHLEPMKGTVDQALAYVSKDDTYEETALMSRQMFGTFKSAGQRRDLEELAEAVVSGEMTVSEIARDSPAQFVRYHGGLQALAHITQTPYSGGPKEIVVLYGPTGCGKTRRAFEENPGAYFWGPEMGKWWPLYQGQKVTIMDEFRGQLPLGYILRLFDRYPMQVECKGGNVHFVSEKILVCSPTHPRLWYESLQEKEGLLDQLMRRISKIEWMGEGDPPELRLASNLLFPQFGLA